MKLTFDTNSKQFSDPQALGSLLMTFSDFYHGGLYHSGKGEGWNQVETADRRYLVAIMGDHIYDDLENTKFSHWSHNNGLHVIWYCDGDDNILFYKEGENGFAIINDKNGLSNHWKIADFNDIRNDPSYDPFK